MQSLRSTFDHDYYYDFELPEVERMPNHYSVFTDTLTMSGRPALRTRMVSNRS